MKVILKVVAWVDYSVCKWVGALFFATAKARGAISFPALTSFLPFEKQQDIPKSFLYMDHPGLIKTTTDCCGCHACLSLFCPIPYHTYSKANFQDANLFLST